MKLKRLFILTGLVSLGVLASCFNSKDIRTDFTFELPDTESLIKVDSADYAKNYMLDTEEECTKIVENYKSIVITCKYVYSEEGNEKGAYAKSITDFETGNTYYYQRDYELIDDKEIDRASVETRSIRGENFYTVLTSITLNEMECLIMNDSTQTFTNAKASGKELFYATVPAGKVVTPKYPESDFDSKLNLQAYVESFATMALGTDRALSVTKAFKSEDEKTLCLQYGDSIRLSENGLLKLYHNYLGNLVDMKVEYSSSPLVNQKLDKEKSKNLSPSELGSFEERYVFPFTRVLIENHYLWFMNSVDARIWNDIKTYGSFLSKYFDISF